MIELFLNRRVSVLRLTKIRGDREIWKTIHRDVPFHIQPFDEAFREDLDGTKGKDFVGACKLLDIKECDKIKEGEDTYSVVGVNENDFLGQRFMDLKIKLLEKC